MPIKRLTIIGVGLIGGSLARALKRARACAEIIGCDVTSAEKAVASGITDSFYTEIGAAVKDAEMVVIAVPLGAMAGVFQQLREYLDDHTILTDVGSVKGQVVEEARRFLGPHWPRFVPGHPVAGTEKSGIEASFAELFAGHRVILTPLAETEATAIERVTELWEQAGARVETMEVTRHDEVLAATSHLPHVLAYSLVQTLAKMEPAGAVFRFAAGGFADLTRIASSSPELWHDIVFANREAVLHLIERFHQELGTVTEAIRAHDSHTLMDSFSRAKVARDAFTAGRQQYPTRTVDRVRKADDCLCRSR
jgi:prephenate dehydrogenase